MLKADELRDSLGLGALREAEALLEHATAGRDQSAGALYADVCAELRNVKPRPGMISRWWGLTCRFMAVRPAYGDPVDEGALSHSPFRSLERDNDLCIRSLALQPDWTNVLRTASLFANAPLRASWTSF
jgi:hypothetical protein